MPKRFFTLDNEWWFWISAVLVGVAFFLAVFGIVSAVR